MTNEQYSVKMSAAYRLGYQDAMRDAKREQEIRAETDAIRYRIEGI